MSLALLFPGQGSQEVGMGRALALAYPAAAETFAQADEILGVSLSDLAWHGPEAELTLTKNAQPALLVHSVAAYRVMEERLGAVGMAAGHSLGEFSALVAAGTLRFQDALPLVRLRGELMYRSGQERAGSMAAILGLDDGAVERVCESVSRPGRACVPANFNCEGQVVVSGDPGAVEDAIREARGAGARKAVALNVSGAFHSPLMLPAQEGLSEALGGVTFSDPRFPVVSNVTAEAVTRGEDARALLVRQLTSPVRWSASIRTMLGAGVDSFVELGTGAVLTGLNKRNARGLPSSAVGEPEQVEAYDRR